MDQIYYQTVFVVGMVVGLAVIAFFIGPWDDTVDKLIDKRLANARKLDADLVAWCGRQWEVPSVGVYTIRCPEWHDVRWVAKDAMIAHRTNGLAENVVLLGSDLVAVCCDKMTVVTTAVEERQVFPRC